MQHAQAMTAQQLLNTNLGLTAPTLARLAFGLAVILTKWHIRIHTRKQLVNLPDYILDDIGLTRDAAYTEARRPFWRA